MELLFGARCEGIGCKIDWSVSPNTSDIQEGCGGYGVPSDCDEVLRRNCKSQDDVVPEDAVL